MKIATCQLKSLSPYNQSRQHFEEKINDGKESHNDYERRTWIEKGHYDSDGVAYIPPMAFKTCLANAAQYLSIKIPGEGNAKYTKHFKAGVMVSDCLSLGVKKSDVVPQWLSMDGQGRKGGMGVMKGFPHFDNWEGVVHFHILDDKVTKEIFAQILKEAGSFIGIGQFRPINGGYFGRFEVLEIEWS